MVKENKTIGLTIRLYTNNLKVEGKKNCCWDVGTMLLEANKEKGLKSDSVPLSCFEDIIPAIKELFRKNKITLVSDNRRPRVLSHKRRK